MTVYQVISIAKAEVGTKESPPNSNNVKYNTWYYGKPVSGSAYPWCATFISWLFKDEPALLKKTASCANMLSWCEKNNLMVSKPEPGCIVFFKYSTNNRRTNHVGLVIKTNPNGSITTIEGNTSKTSNDNGGAVMERVRTSNIVAYAMPKYDVTKKSIDELAQEVIDGKWGTGAVRKSKLTAAGYSYEAVQKRVNEILKG